jgi:translation elongation factor EF-1beta
MGRVLYIVRVMPTDSDVDLEELLRRIKESLRNLRTPGHRVVSCEK